MKKYPEPTKSNCNYWLTEMYHDRDNVGERISWLNSHLRNTDEEEHEYAQICKDIMKFIKFRQSNDCLLQGDCGYGPV